MVYLVHIKEIKTDKIVKTLSYNSESQQSRAMLGVSINLNHDEYYIDMEDKEL